MGKGGKFVDRRPVHGHDQFNTEDFYGRKAVFYFDILVEHLGIKAHLKFCIDIRKILFQHAFPHPPLMLCQF